MKIYAFYVFSESGDIYDGWFKSDGTESDKAKHVVRACESEVQEMVRFEGYDLEWAYENPEEALDESLLSPEYIEINLEEN